MIIKQDESLAAHTSMKVGGRAKTFIIPFTKEELIKAALEYPEAFILGGGSNLVISDKGFQRRPVILTTSVKEIKVEAGEGASDSLNKNATAKASGTIADNAVEKASDKAGEKASGETVDNTSDKVSEKASGASGKTVDSAGDKVSERVSNNTSYNASDKASGASGDSKKVYEKSLAGALGKTVFVTADCGALVASFVAFCADNELGGAEEFAGLPGSIGGAVFMNARCFSREVSDILVGATYLDENGKVCTYKMNKAEWGYKRSPLRRAKVILSATFALTKKVGESGAIKARCKSFVKQRVEKGHFLKPSAGSVFLNDRAFGKPSGAIIDKCGLKGLSIGGAQVAPFHANFIINNGGATERDIKALVEKVQEEVKKQTGFALKCEILFVGD